jgi:hypothetical protein
MTAPSLQVDILVYLLGNFFCLAYVSRPVRAIIETCTYAIRQLCMPRGSGPESPAGQGMAWGRRLETSSQGSGAEKSTVIAV